MSTPTTNRRFVRANFVVAAGTGLSRLTGFGRVAALAYALGQTSLTDTYNLANTMPNVVYELLLGGILTTTLVPVFVSHLDHDDEEATDAVVSVAVVVLLALTVVAVLAAPLIVHLYTLRVPAVDQGAVRSEATTLARFFLPQIVFYGITSLGIALLNSRRRFAAAAFAPVLNNVIVIAALIALPHVVNGDINLDTALGNHSITLLLGLSTTGGIIAMTAVVWIAVGHAGIHIRPRLLWRHPAVSEVARLSGWTVGYVIANQIALLVVSILALRGEGELSAYQAAFIFFQLPHGLLAVTLITTFAPELAEAASRGDQTGYKDRLSLGIRLIALVIAPAAIGYAVLARPLVSALIERGALVEQPSRPHREHARLVRCRASGLQHLLVRAQRLLRAQGHPSAVLPQRRRERDQHRSRHRVRGPMGRAGPRRLVRGRLHDLCGARDVVAVTRHGWPRPALARSRRRAPDRRRDRDGRARLGLGLARRRSARHGRPDPLARRCRHRRRGVCRRAAFAPRAGGRRPPHPFEGPIGSAA